MTTRIGHGKKKSNEWQESNVDYIFDSKMNGTSLIKRLNWIGGTNDSMNKFSSMQNDDDDEQGNKDGD